MSGLCPACLLNNVLSDEDDPLAAPRLGPVGLIPDSTLGPFRIGRLIGKGGMAAVYEAYEGAPLERTIALKVLPAEFLHDDTFARRFVHEARVIASLEHPGIVPIYASGIDEGIPWISMRLLTGGTLNALLQQGRPGIDRTIKVLTDVGGALEYAHARGVIHRDVKPSNILLDDGGRAYICDFGLARLVEGIEHWTRTGTLVGTPQYMAPEQASDGKVDERCDTYSLGVVAYEMLTGSPPFTAATPIAVLMQHVNAPVPPALRQRCPESIAFAVEKALAKNPGDRWESTTAFVNALEPSTVVHSLRGRRTRIAMVVGFTVTTAAAGSCWFTPDATTQITRAEVPDNPLVGPAVLPPLLPPLLLLANLDATGSPQQISGNSEPTPISPPLQKEERDGAVVDAKDKSEPPREASDTKGPVTQIVGVKESIQEDPPKDPAQPLPVQVPVETKAERIRGVNKLVYAANLRDVAIRGIVPRQTRVVLSGLVGIDGHVTGIQLVGKAHPLVEAEARKAFLQFLYKPAQKNDVAVSSTVEETFEFYLKD